jgi:hypothetical protein
MTTSTSSIDYRLNEWFLPVTQHQYTESKIGAFSLFTGEAFKAPFKIAWPSILTGMIIIMIVGMIILGIIVGCFVGDIVYPVANPGWFTLETMVMSFGSAALVFLFMYTRSISDSRPPIGETLQEFALLVAKFGIVHLFFQFTGFYSWAFPDSALGGICNTPEHSWLGYNLKGTDLVAAERNANIKTSDYSVHDHNNPNVVHEGFTDNKLSTMDRLLRRLPLGH